MNKTLEAQKNLESFLVEISTESRLANVGLKDSPDLTSIVRRYRELFTSERVKEARQVWEAAPSGDEKERARRLYLALLEMNVSQETVELSDEVQAFLLSAEVGIDGERLPYYQALSEIQHEPDFKRRERIQSATLTVVEGANSLWRRMLEKELATLRGWGYSGILEFVREEKGVDYAAFRKKLQSLHESISPTYLSAMDAWTRELIDHPFPRLHRAHLPYLRGMHHFDRDFPSATLLSVAERSLADLGFPLSECPQIQVDAEDRPKKNPRAACYATKIPEEIHLIIKPAGGYHDYEAFFHEAGHALHFGLSDPSLPFEYRYLSPSHALTEVYSFLVESLTGQPDWLVRYLGLAPKRAREIARTARLVNLMMLMRYIGKLHYELAFHEDPLNDERNRKLYAGTLTGMSGFTYDPVSYLDDMDSGLYVADYLRAWITQAMLEEYLTREVGEEWYASRKTGEFLRELWAKGVSLENEDLARRLGYEPWDTGPLARQYEGLR